MITELAPYSLVEAIAPLRQQYYFAAYLVAYLATCLTPCMIADTTGEILLSANTTP
jgi:hypothetical protein